MREINRDKIILDLCGGTGSWSRPYKDAGYDVRLITLPDNDVRTYLPPANVYGILVAPPCTEFSVAKGSKPRNFREAFEVVRACLNIIWTCRLTGTLKFWAMENPRGFLRQFLGIPHFTFEHWHYGDLQLKPTDLWGYFNIPPRKLKYKPIQLASNTGKLSHGQGWVKPKCPKEYEDLNLDRAAIRAITPPGFAKAFFGANK